jgi:uncharacterized protein (TIGR02597 family)
MNPSSFSSKIIASLALAIASAATAWGQASVTTDAVGFNTVSCLSASDTRCSVPFSPETAYTGTISAATTAGVSAGQALLTASGTPAWTANQYANFYYVKMTSGAKDGMFYQVMANGTGDVTVDLAGDTLGVVAGDSFRIHRFWTLSTLFPLATQTTIGASTGNLTTQRRTQVLLPNLTGAGINLAPSRIFFMVGPTAGGFVGTEWREATAGNVQANDTILTPDSYFIIRHPASVATTTFTVAGNVDATSNTTVLNVLSTGKQDNPVTHGRPVDVRLADLDLISSGAFTPSTGNLTLQRRDELLVYDNAVAGINKAASAVYFYVSGTPGEWRKATAGNVNADNDVIGPSQGFVIRKYNSATAPSWKQTL